MTQPPSPTWKVVGSIKGPPGADGDAAAVVHVQTTPQLLWVFSLGPDFINPPSVDVFVDDRQMIPNMHYDTATRTVTLSFRTPTLGRAVARP